MIIIKTKKSTGFTLVEMIVSVGLFSLIAAISIGAVIMIFDSNRRSQSSKTVVDNLNLTLENMTRTVRFGETYHCGSSGNINTIQNCDSGSDTLAVNFKGNTIVYRKCGNVIKRSETGSTNCNNMGSLTSPDTVIQDLRFYVLGAGNSGAERLKQPYVVAVVKGYVGPRPTLQSNFLIQTMMSQRKIEY